MKNRLRAFLGWVCAFLLSTLSVVVLWQVLSRYILASPSSVSEELARILLMWLGLLGAGYAHLDSHHIAIQLFPKVAPEHRTNVSLAVCQVFATVLLVGGVQLCGVTFQLHQTTPILGWPQGLVYLVLPLSGVLLTIGNLFHLRESTS